MKFLNYSLDLGIFFVTFISLSDGYIRRVNYDGILKESKLPDSKYVQYTRTAPEKWKNLTSLVNEHKFNIHEVFCTRGEGAWIGYPSENYMIGEGLAYTLITGEACLNAQDYASLQPIGDFKMPFDSGVILFPQENFQSTQRILQWGSYSGEVRSLIFSGSTAWSITSGSSTVCLMPTHRKSVAYDFCMLPALDASLGFSGSGIKIISQGCNAPNVRLVSVQNCYTKGVYRIIPSHDFSLSKMKQHCGTHIEPKMQASFVQIMEIWKGRISGGIEDMNNIKISHEAIYQMKLLWQIVDIFKGRCPSIDNVYLSILRNVFLMHLRKVWARNPSIVKPEDEFWRHTAMFLDACGTHTHAVSLDNPSTCSPLNEPPSNRRDWKAFLEFTSGTDYDLVIEQIWLIMNTVIPSCNSINGHRTNEWANVVSMLRNHFLEPLGNQWLHPGDWQKLYIPMFHGYNIKKMRSQVIKCAQDTLLGTPEFNPVGRSKYVLHEQQSLAADGLRPGSGDAGPKLTGTGGGTGEDASGRSVTKPKKGKAKGPVKKTPRESQYSEYVENDLGKDYIQEKIHGLGEFSDNFGEDEEEYEKAEKEILMMSLPNSEIAKGRNLYPSHGFEGKI